MKVLTRPVGDDLAPLEPTTALLGKNMKRNECPICGYNQIDILDDQGCTTFEICDSCGCESGYDYSCNSSELQLEIIRREWVLNKKCEWFSSLKPPTNWDPYEQMRKAGINIPK